MNYSQNQEQFYADAMDMISNNPASRLSRVTRAVIERQNFIFDAHCHVFDGKCINLLYMVTRMIASLSERLQPEAWEVLTGQSPEKMLRSLHEINFTEEVYNNLELREKNDMNDDFLEDIYERANEAEYKLNLNEKKSLEEFKLREFLKKLRSIIKLLRSGQMRTVYEHFKDEFAVTNVYDQKKELLTIVLGMDLNKGWEGKIKKSNHKQITELSELAEAYPVLPFLPLDPRRADDTGVDNLYEIFLNAFKEGGSNYFGVKFYPALGYLPSDYRLEKIFKICAEKKIPVVSHCGGEIVSTFAKSIKVFRGKKEETVPGRKRAERAAFLNEPKEWEPVLNNAPGLHLNLGHFGSGTAWADPSSPKAARIDIILELMGKYKVFSDFSFNIEDKDTSNTFCNALRNNKLMQERTMFGTDYWVVLPMSNLKEDQRYFLDKAGVHAEDLLVTNVMRFLHLDQLLNRAPEPVESASAALKD